MIGLIDYGLGNLKSAYSAVAFADGDPFIIAKPSDFDRATAVILPGVGHFHTGIHNLEEYGFIDVLNRFVIEKGMPCLGICLGMQMMATTGYEGGEKQGLGWIEGTVEEIKTCDESYRIPHVGWNDVKVENGSRIFDDVSPSVFYFVHKYQMVLSESERKKYLIATTYHGTEITAGVNKDNIYGLQFHPEKSQREGIQVLRNFISLVSHA